MKEWLINFRVEDSPENRTNIGLLMRHAWLKSRSQPGGMKSDNMSEFMRFLLNYYKAREVGGK